MKRLLYKVRWYGTRENSVDISTTHDTNAIRSADKIGRELGLNHVPRIIMQGTRCVQNSTPRTPR